MDGWIDRWMDRFIDRYFKRIEDVGLLAIECFIKTRACRMRVAPVVAFATY